MLDNHDLNRLIGRWDNLHVEGALLVADPVFDDGITLGAERKGQVERGFLRGASPGIVILRAEYRTNPAGGEDLYVTEWELFEGSVTSVPSNAGAVTLKIYTGDGHLVEDGDVRLHVDNIVKLCAESSPQGRKPNIKPMEKITLSAEAYVALGINQDADATAMSKAIVQLALNIHREYPSRHGLDFGPYDLGSAVQNMLLQAEVMGLHMRPFATFDRELVSRQFQISAPYTAFTMCSVGKEPAGLTKERERKPLEQLLWENHQD